jgi:hypothetical protein
LNQEVSAEKLLQGKSSAWLRPSGDNGWSDEDKGSLPQGRVNWPEQVLRLVARKIDRSAEAFGAA